MIHFIARQIKSIVTNSVRLANKRVTNSDDWVEMSGLALVNTAKITPFALMFEYATGLVTDNVLFIFWWVVIMGLNMLVGTVTHLKLGTFDWKEFLINNSVTIVLTTSVYMSLYGALEVQGDLASKTIIKSMQVGVYMYPLSKIFKNSHILTDGIFPPDWIISKLFKKDENLQNYRELINRTRDNDNNK